VLGGLSLMHENPMQLLGPLARMATTGQFTDPGKELLAEAASQTNPLFKGLAEWTTGKSFWQRGPGGLRDVEEQDPIIGRTISNITGQKEPTHFPGEGWIEPLFANTLSRVGSTARKAFDPRKRAQWAIDAGVPSYIPVPGGAALANLLGGFQIVDVSPRSQDAIVREAAQAALMKSGFGKQYENVYVPKAVREQLGPEQSMEIEQTLALLRELTKRAKQRAQGGVGQPIGSGLLLP